MSAVDEAAAWLRRELAGGPRTAEDLEESAMAEGIAWPTVKRAKRAAGVESRRIGFGKAGRWVLCLAGTPADGEGKGDQPQPTETTREERPARPIEDQRGSAPERPPREALVAEPGPPRAIGRYERLAWERHDRDLALCAQPGGHPRGLWFDPEEGDRVIQFIETYCTHHQGKWAGRPFLLQEWQKRLVRQLFGWKRADGTRRFRVAYWEIGRKNGKTELAGAIALYLLVADGEQGAQVYAAATKEEQAAIVWGVAEAFVDKNPKLRRLVRRRKLNLSVERTRSKFIPLGSDSETEDGLNPSGIVADELHAWKDRGLWDVLHTALGAREQPLTVAITTAGVFDVTTICWEKHKRATDILEGLIEEDSFHAFIASAYEGQETDRRLEVEPDYYFSLEAQQKANPNWGVSIKPDDLVQGAKDAKEQPSELDAYLRLRLNVWVQSSRRWLSMESWGKSDPIPHGTNVRKLAAEREAALRGRPCYGGLDYAIRLDLVAFVLAFPLEDGVVEFVSRFWLPEATVREYSKKGQAFFDVWVREGWLKATPGTSVDQAFIQAEILSMAKVFNIREIAFDQWNADDLAVRLQEEDLKLVHHGQNFREMSAPSKDLETRVVGLKVRHAGNPILRWCAANAIVKLDPAGNYKPDKAKSSGKIDGIIAAVEALSRLNANAATKPPENPYKERGFLQL